MHYSTISNLVRGKAKCQNKRPTLNVLNVDTQHVSQYTEWGKIMRKSIVLAVAGMAGLGLLTGGGGQKKAEEKPATEQAPANNTHQGC